MEDSHDRHVDKEFSNIEQNNTMNIHIPCRSIWNICKKGKISENLSEWLKDLYGRQRSAEYPQNRQQYVKLSYDREEYSDIW